MNLYVQRILFFFPAPISSWHLSPDSVCLDRGVSREVVENCQWLDCQVWSMDGGRWLWAGFEMLAHSSDGQHTHTDKASTSCMWTGHNPDLDTEYIQTLKRTARTGTNTRTHRKQHVCTDSHTASTDMKIYRRIRSHNANAQTWKTTHTIKHTRLPHYSQRPSIHKTLPFSLLTLWFCSTKIALMSPKAGRHKHEKILIWEVSLG